MKKKMKKKMTKEEKTAIKELKTGLELIEKFQMTPTLIDVIIKKGLMIDSTTIKQLGLHLK